jgi:hypothetical protein
MFTLLAILQLHSTWANSHSRLDQAVNDDIHKLEASIDSSHQQLKVRNIKLKTKEVETVTTDYNNVVHRTVIGLYHYAFILYEIIDIE